MPPNKPERRLPAELRKAFARDAGGFHPEALGAQKQWTNVRVGASDGFRVGKAAPISGGAEPPREMVTENSWGVRSLGIKCRGLQSGCADSVDRRPQKRKRLKKPIELGRVPSKIRDVPGEAKGKSKK